MRLESNCKGKCVHAPVCVPFASAPAALWPASEASGSDDVSGFGVAGKVSRDGCTRSVNTRRSVEAWGIRRAGEEPEWLLGTETKRPDMKAR